MNELTEVKMLDMETEEERTETLNSVRESIADMWQDDEEMASEAYTASYKRLQEMAEGLGYLLHTMRD